MKTRRMFLIALCGVAMLTGTSSCKKEKQENENGEKMVIKASLGSAGNNSKTHLEGPSVMWDPADAFKLFPTDGMAGTEFTLTRIDDQDGTVAYFEGSHPGGEHFYACYPFSNVSCNTPGTFEFEIPESQSDVTNAGPMVGYMEEPSGSLVFQNAMSWLKVGLKGNVVIKRVVLTDTDGNALNGTLTVTCSNEGDFSFETLMSGTDETANQLEIVSNNGTQLSSDEYTYFWFMVPEGSLEKLKLSAYVSTDEAAQDLLNLEESISGGIAGNSIVTANVNSAYINITGATIQTGAGCSDRHMYEFFAKVTGNDNNFTLYEVGFCYNLTSDESPAQDPTIDHCDGSVEIGTFTIGNGSTKDITYDLAWLEDGKKYKVCAYAMNGCYSYGNVETVEGGNGPKPLPIDWVNGTNPHTFKISSTKSVYFSQANLQYRAQGGIGGNAIEHAESGENVGGTWRFAEHQFDFIGNDNGKMAWNYDGWIDLFGFGTSGYNHNGKSYQPWSTSTENSDYYAYSPTVSSYNLEKEPGTADWGKNTIYAGETQTPTGWRTLTQTEWNYLINSRNAGFKGEGKVGSCTPGLILLPDDWDWSKTTLAGLQSKWNKNGASDWANVYSYSEWAMMEAEGAIFLPAAGYRNGTGAYTVDAGADYHASTASGNANAKELHFESNKINPGDTGKRCHGHSVRLVKNAN